MGNTPDDFEATVKEMLGDSPEIADIINTIKSQMNEACQYDKYMMAIDTVVDSANMAKEYEQHFTITADDNVPEWMREHATAVPTLLVDNLPKIMDNSRIYAEDRRSYFIIMAAIQVWIGKIANVMEMAIEGSGESETAMKEQVELLKFIANDLQIFNDWEKSKQDLGIDDEEALQLFYKEFIEEQLSFFNQQEAKS